MSFFVKVVLFFFYEIRMRQSSEKCSFFFFLLKVRYVNAYFLYRNKDRENPGVDSNGIDQLA